MNSTGNEFETARGGNFIKGFGLGLLCQFAHLLFLVYLPSDEVRGLGYLLFALVQFVYLLPLAVFFQRRKQGLTSNGLIVVGALALLAEAAWFGYSAVHGTLPAINPN
jgi:hypothetical protein